MKALFCVFLSDIRKNIALFERLQFFLFSPSLTSSMTMNMWYYRNDADWEIRSPRRAICSSASLSTTNPIQNGPSPIPNLRFHRPSTNIWHVFPKLTFKVGVHKLRVPACPGKEVSNGVTWYFWILSTKVYQTFGRLNQEKWDGRSSGRLGEQGRCIEGSDGETWVKEATSKAQA
jgi:hypothetical protein